MKRAIAALTSIAILIQVSGAAAQEVDPDDPLAVFGIPDAPEVVPPGWPPPEDLCAIEADYDFEADPYNPGLHTVDQFRVWSISGADRNNPQHLYLLGLMHEYGYILHRDERRAAEYFRRAFEAGDRRAGVRLAKYYCRRELYCSADRALYKLAIDDYGPAQTMLSKMYRWGLGVWYDPVAAYQWAWLGMEKTPGNWIVHDLAGVRYLESLEKLITDDELERAEFVINEFKRGIGMPSLQCKQDG